MEKTTRVGCWGRMIRLLVTVAVAIIIFWAGVSVGRNSLPSANYSGADRLASSTSEKVPAYPATKTPLPTVTARPISTLAPGMYGSDTLGLPYKLIAPEGLALNEWIVSELEDGGIKFSFSISTPSKKFDSDLSAGVTYYNDSGEETGKSRTIFLGSMNRQDRDTRSYKNNLSCEWGSCPDTLDKSTYYVVEFEVDLIDMP